MGKLQIRKEASEFFQSKRGLALVSVLGPICYATCRKQQAEPVESKEASLITVSDTNNSPF